ncbi:AMP-binding protein [Candidatus Pelagibacter sp. RS39]|uniref:AMP-binding protein n=1 Tax=Candidatus Pelagibacter sp. RS39 TaxID=1977864 RepID=UPI00202A7315|nr:AMP-binding protein [Candidatus Pelagibacter sp. RS39]
MQLSRINNLVELFFTKYEEINSVGDKRFLKWLKENEKDFLTWQQVALKIQIFSEYLRTKLNKGDRCILLSENRPEWLISDISIMNAGGVTVPLFTTYSEKDYEYIINDCKPKICVVSNEIQLKKIEKFISDEIKVLSIEKIISSERVENIENIFNEHSKKNKSNPHISFNQNLERKDLACIIYTSGTTGNPKGVMLSHGGILSNCEGAQEILNQLVQDSEPTFLTWLPLSHSYEHAVQFVQISLGAKIYYAESLEKLLSNMSIAKPTIMTAVPRFYQNLYSKISMNFSKQKGFKKKLISSTISLGTKELNNKSFTLREKLINFFCEKLVRKKIKNQFGGKLKAFVSGGGCLRPKNWRIFKRYRITHSSRLRSYRGLTCCEL